MDSPPDYEETPLIDESESKRDGAYMPGPPPDYTTALNMNDFGPPRYQDPYVEGHHSEYPEQASPRGNFLRLAYADFLPYCFQRGDKTTQRKPVFDTFKGVFQYANHWLSNNPIYKVIDIESIERRVGFDGQVDSGEVIEHTAAYGTNGILRGVRLWLVPNPDPTAAPQTIAYFNWLPEEDPVTQQIYLRHGSHAFVQGSLLFPNFKRMSHTLRSLNECIMRNPIPGTIMSVQTLELLYQQAWGKKCLDPDLSSYFSTGDKNKLFLNYLRIFYLVGPPTTQKVGLADFAPVVSHKSPSINAKPRVDEYRDVFQKASTWIYQNDSKTAKVMNIQNIYFKAGEYDLFRSSVGDVLVDPDVTWYRELVYSNFIKVVRMAYVELKEPENRSPLPMTSRLFIPIRTGPKTAETLPETLYRINAWLNLTGVGVVSIGTEKFQFYPQLFKNAIKPDLMISTVDGTRGIYNITGIRLFLSGVFIEPWEEEPFEAGSIKDRSKACLMS